MEKYYFLLCLSFIPLPFIFGFKKDMEQGGSCWIVPGFLMSLSLANLFGMLGEALFS